MGVRVVNRNPLILLIPILIDAVKFITFYMGYVYHFLPGLEPTTGIEAGKDFYRVIPRIPPTIEDVLTIEWMPMADRALTYAPEIIALLVISIIISAFFKGSYLGMLRLAVKDEKVVVKDLFENGKYYFVRFFVLWTVLALVNILFAYFALITQSMVFIIVVSLVVMFYILLEYSIVIEDLTLINAIARAPQVLASSFIRFAGLFIIAVVINWLLSMVVNAAGTAVLILGILLTAYINTVIIAAVIEMYLNFLLRESGTA